MCSFNPLREIPPPLFSHYAYTLQHMEEVLEQNTPDKSPLLHFH